MKAVVVRGHIGWANSRSGTEFYDDAGRHVPRQLAGGGQTGERGALLVDAIDTALGGFGYSEGATVLVLVQPRLIRLSLRQRLAARLLR